MFSAFLYNIEAESLILHVNPRILREKPVQLSRWAKANKWSENEGAAWERPADFYKFLPQNGVWLTLGKRSSLKEIFTLILCSQKCSCELDKLIIHQKRTRPIQFKHLQRVFLSSESSTMLKVRTRYSPGPHFFSCYPSPVDTTQVLIHIDQKLLIVLGVSSVYLCQFAADVAFRRCSIRSWTVL